MELYELQWEEKIAYHAYRSLKEGRRNNPQLLPLAEDVAKFSRYLKKEVNLWKGELELAVDQETIKVARSRLAEVLLAQIIVLTARDQERYPR